RHYSTKPDSNRIEQTWYGSSTPEAVTYRHDAHGNVLNLNRLATPPPLGPNEDWALDLRWDWRDMVQQVDLGGGGSVSYQYGGDKQRSRKHIARPGGTEDHVSLGTFDRYQRCKLDGTVIEEIESHHLSADGRRVLLVDDVIRTGGVADPRADGLSVR